MKEQIKKYQPYFGLMQLMLILLIINHSIAYSQSGNEDSELKQIVIKSDDQPQIKVTYTVCEGFIIEVADKKIMIDVLTARRFLKRQSAPDSLIYQMENALPPFDNVDVILATHAHIDHFDPDLIVQYMEANKDVQLVCPKQASDIIETLGGIHRVEKRINSIAYRPFHPVELEIKGIQIKCLPLSHNGVAETDSVNQNMGYLIKYNGRTILHIGDNNFLSTKLSYEQYQLNNESIDVAFLQSLFWNDNQFQKRREFVTNFVNPKYIVLMHLMNNQDLLSNVTDEMIDAYPEMFYFKEFYESKKYK